MAIYHIDIQYPINIEGSDTSTLTEQLEGDVLQQFETFKWWQYRTLQVQVNGGQTHFAVTCVKTEQTIRFTLLSQSENGQIEVMMESDLVVLTPKKELFGLMTRQIKNYIGFEKLSLTQAKNYLNLFLNQNIAALEAEYKSLSQQTESAA